MLIFENVGSKFAYSAHLRGALHGELDGDFVKLPVREIEKHLAA
jgi:hypothetical protein